MEHFRGEDGQANKLQLETNEVDFHELNPLTEESKTHLFKDIEMIVDEEEMVEDSQEHSSKKVLDHIPRIEVEMEPDQPLIVSYHYLYKEYLEDNNLLDVRLLI